MDLGIKGKYALVTGGSHGIGLSTALNLADEGCHVAICARTLTKLETARGEIVAKGVQCLALQADVLELAAIERTVAAVIAQWGTIHILVNNAGGGGRWGSEKIEETPETVWMDVYNKNVFAAVRFIKLVLPHMKKNQWGRIVTISSVHGKQAGGRPWFNIAKTAETVLMKNLSLKPEYVRHGITFNSIAPGCIFIPNTGWHEFKMNKPREYEQMLDHDFPLGRMGSPEEVARVVVFTCSTVASLVNGASIVVDGGESKVF
jgi:3-oxoacyl-[acyl-carrier protein] reductase